MSFGYYPVVDKDELMLIYVKFYVSLVRRSGMSASSYEGNPPPPGTLTVSEAAQLLHVHPNTIRNWSDNGLLKVYRLGHRRDRRFSVEDVKNLLTNEPT